MSDAAEPCKLLPWDSEWFGFPVARVLGNSLTVERAKHIDVWCRNNRVRCLYFLSRSDDSQTINTAQDLGYRLTDVRMTFDREVASVADFQIRPGIRKARPDDFSSIKRLARMVFRDSRFYFDTNFPIDRVHAMFERWVERAMEEASHQHVLVSTDAQDQVSGFLLFGIDPATKASDLALLAVAPTARGKGLARQLIEASFDEIVKAGVDRVTVVTQGRNVSAQRLYQRIGFLTQSVQFYYHKWF